LSVPGRWVPRRASRPLKMLELTSGDVQTMHETTLGLRHGPMSSLNMETLFTGFISSEDRQRLLRTYSYGDRIRYCWRAPEAEAVVERLMRNLQRTAIPETLLSQFCPRQYDEVRAGTLKNDAKELVLANVRTVPDPYSRAGPGKASPT
jgi:tagatose-6-phosphate kinase